MLEQAQCDPLHPDLYRSSAKSLYMLVRCEEKMADKKADEDTIVTSGARWV